MAVLSSYWYNTIVLIPTGWVITKLSEINEHIICGIGLKDALNLVSTIRFRTKLIWVAAVYCPEKQFHSEITNLKDFVS